MGKVTAPDKIDGVALSAKEEALWTQAFTSSPEVAHADEVIRQLRIDETEQAAKRAGHEAFVKARAAGTDVAAADEVATVAYRDAGGTKPELLTAGSEALPEAVVGPEEQLKGASGIQEMPDHWWPGEIRFEMQTEAPGGGKVVRSAEVGEDDDPAEIFHNLRIALWRAAQTGDAAEAAKPSTHCPDCGAPAWAAVPNRVGKS